jgi:hypothetical protein
LPPPRSNQKINRDRRVYYLKNKQYNAIRASVPQIKIDEKDPTLFYPPPYIKKIMSVRDNGDITEKDVLITPSPVPKKKSPLFG